MFALTEKLNCFLHRIHPLQGWIKKYELNGILFSYVNYFSECSEKKYDKPPLVIFDIDNTLLDATSFYKYPILQGIDPCIAFYKYIKQLGFPIVLLTGRKEEKRDITVKNLKKVHIEDYENLIMRENNLDNITNYKLKQRILLSQKYTIIANIGDQITDFQGGFNGKIIHINF